MARLERGSEQAALVQSRGAGERIRPGGFGAEPWLTRGVNPAVGKIGAKGDGISWVVARGEVMVGSVPPARGNMGTDSREAGDGIAGAAADVPSEGDPGSGGADGPAAGIMRVVKIVKRRREGRQTEREREREKGKGRRQKRV